MSPESAEMPFLDHLEELRWRILWSLLALMVGVVIAFVLFMNLDVIGILEKPILPFLGGRKLVYTHPGDPFQIVMGASVPLGIVLAMPVIVYQVWAFVAPALFSHERKVIIPVFFGAIFLFLGGASLCYFFVLPLALKWLMGFQSAALEPMITASEYFGFATSMTLAFGLSFELPIVILLLATLGIVTPAFLSKYRRHAIVACVIIGAFLTPGDLVWTTLLMAVPLYMLYEVSIVLAIIVHRRRSRRASAAESEPIA